MSGHVTIEAFSIPRYATFHPDGMQECTLDGCAIFQDVALDLVFEFGTIRPDGKRFVSKFGLEICQLRLDFIGKNLIN